MLKPFKPLTIRRPDTVAAAQDDCFDPPSKRRKLNPDDDDKPADAPTASSGLLTRTARSSKDRKPLLPLLNPPSSPEEKSSTSAVASYYAVLWRNPTTKKNKTWTGDGALSVASGVATISDGSGRRLGQCKFDRPLLPGSTLTVSGKEIEIDSCISRDAYLSITKAKPDAKKKTSPTSIEAKPSPVMPTTACKSSLQDKLKEAKSFDAKKPESQRSAQTASNPDHDYKRSSGFKPPIKEARTQSRGPVDVPTPRYDPNAPDALVFKRPSSAPQGQQIIDVVLDPELCTKLRPHQKQGVRFMYECVMGLRDFGGQGCILADDMGLGKSLQTIALLWTLIKQNPIWKAPPVVKKALIVCPVSLIKNWTKEFKKWLPISRFNLGVLQFEDPKTTRLSMFDGKVYNVMIIGYERLRTVADELAESHDVDIVICDEGHRLKTVKNKSAKAIEALNTARRVILSGTPIQNDLSELYAMANFVNEGCLGSARAFFRDFETPIMKSRQPGATEDVLERGKEAGNELANTMSPFILRRTAAILSEYLPSKTEYVLFCKPTPEQAAVYRSIIDSPMFRTAFGSIETALQLITILKKLCNSPALMRPAATGDERISKSLQTLSNLLPSGLNKYYHNAASSKIRLLDVLLQDIRRTTNEKVVLVSNYTSTLNLMSGLLDNSGLKYLRLDGTVPAKQRQALVERFNRARPSQYFAFLLSAKAGGVGIDLTGASRLVLFDVDWNPATDDQAIARIHRQGQRRPTKIYRFLIKGGLEERIWQRQVVKRGLAESIMENKDEVGDEGASNTTLGKSGRNNFSQQELKDLFRFNESEGLKTHELIRCKCNGEAVQATSRAQDEEEKQFWEESGSASDRETSPDLPDISGFIRGSQLSSNYPENDSGITSPVKKARKRRQECEKDAEAEALMQYQHLDTSSAPQLDDSSEALQNLEHVLDDACLMHVVRQSEDVVSGGISWIFKKSTGANSAGVERGSDDNKKEELISDFFASGH